MPVASANCEAKISALAATDTVKLTAEVSGCVTTLTAYINDVQELTITDKGIELLEEFHRTLKTKDERDQNKEFRNAIENIKDYFNDFTTDEMLAFIYKSFPNYVEYSIRKEKLDYIKIFLNLYEKGKLGISKIAELMGCSYDEAYDLIKKNTKPIMLL